MTQDLHWPGFYNAFGRADSSIAPDMLSIHGRQKRALTRQASFFLVLALLLFPFKVCAQYAGHRGNSAGSHGGRTTGQPTEDPDLTGFKHDVAVQATDAQRLQFQTLSKSMETARQRAHDLQRPTSGSDSSTFLSSATSLRDAVDDAQRENRDFVNSFSDAQDSGLRKLTRKLIKSNGAVTKHAGQLDAELERIPLDAHKLTSLAASLQKALGSLQADQLALAKEMGISLP